jgi:hypothetical protein
MKRRKFISKTAVGTMGLSIVPWYAGVQEIKSDMKSGNHIFESKSEINPSNDTQFSLDWIHDSLVVAMPAAAVGGCQAGIYTAAENGVKPWHQALIRWLTSRDVQGNAGVLVRQEGQEGGAGLTAIVDPHADYLFEVNVHLPGGKFFGDAQDKDLQLWSVVMDGRDRVIAEEQAKVIYGDWVTVRLSFASGSLREVRCIVQARSAKYLPCMYYVEGFYLTRKDHAWWNPQNIFCSSRNVARLKDERELLVNTLDPDVVGGHNGVYLNWDRFFTKKGIVIGGGHWEQEYNHLSVDDPMVEEFRDDGMVRELDGSIVTTSKLWPGYHMCHNAPGWHSYYKKRLTRVAPEVHTISQDNICSASFMSWGKNGCFCRWCRDGFRKWLRQSWTPGQFIAAGIEDPDNLNIVEYVNKVKDTTISKGADAVLADPVLRAYVRYSYISQSDRWRDSVEAVKQAAGHPIAVCGNQYGSNGSSPYSTILSQINDVICTETGIGGGTMTTTARTWNALATKTSFAAGEYRRPVWLYLSSLFHTSKAAKSRLQMVNSQAWSDGGVPMPWATAPGSSGWFYDIETKMCRFVQEHRDLFLQRESIANVGLVYSLPTNAWRNFSAFGLSSEKYSKWFVTLAQLLEETNIPYEVNCWWHPLLGDEKASLERLTRYKVLILPGIDCFSDAQRDAVRAFQARGGQVISITCKNLYDDDALPRPYGQTLASSGKNLIEIKPDLLNNYESSYKKLKAILLKSLAGDKILETDAPSEIWSNVWINSTRKVLSLHMVNGNIDTASDNFRVIEGSKWEIRLPEGLTVNEALVISPDLQSETKSLPVKVKNGRVTVIVPRIESYTIVALYSGKALIEAEEIARLRRSKLRASLIPLL